MIQYYYREKFKLSYEDYMNEPYEAYKNNLLVMRAESEYKGRKVRWQERKMKIGKN